MLSGKVVVVTGASSGIGDVAVAIAWALERLRRVGVNEIVLRPTRQVH